jgi:hypothetical protein
MASAASMPVKRENNFSKMAISSNDMKGLKLKSGSS